MKAVYSCFLAFLFLFQVSAETPLDTFLNNHSDIIYQDIVIDNEIYAIGSDSCEPRYELIRPVLDSYEGSFSVLDLGAAQGYFSFRIAHDYPKSSCVMVESNNTSYYAHHGDMLYDLCFLNDYLPNTIYLQKRMNLSDLSYLNKNEHFDVIIAFLVVHLMDESLQKQIDILKSLLALGDNLIIEVADDVGVIHTSYVDYLSQKLDCEFVGEVKRHKDPLSTSKGRIYWFKQQRVTKKGGCIPFKGIQKETFHHLNGVYPKDF